MDLKHELHHSAPWLHDRLVAIALLVEIFEGPRSVRDLTKEAFNDIIG